MSKRQNNKEKYKKYDEKTQEKYRQHWSLYNPYLEPYKGETSKQCYQCKKSKILSRFYKRLSSYDGLAAECKDCAVKHRKKLVLELKARIVKAYGGRCACPKCPETNISFLTIDHVNNDGHVKRKNGLYFYYTIVKESFPDKYRIMCWNCNCGRAQNNGICPHESVEM